MTVGPLPVTEIAGRPIAGLLGRDFLSLFDLDLDLPDHRMTLYDVHGCDAWFLPWTTPYAAIPASMPMAAALVVQVLVDGRPLRALIDTGASSSLITASGMFRLGVMTGIADARSCRQWRGVGPAPVPMHLHRFAELRVGPDVMRDPRYGSRRCASCRSWTCCSAPTGCDRGECGCRSRRSRCSWRNHGEADAPSPIACGRNP